MATDVPEYLYKYRSLLPADKPFTKDIVENSRLWWGSPDSFNDPFDCAPVVITGDNDRRNSALMPKMQARKELKYNRFRKINKGYVANSQHPKDGGYLKRLMSRHRAERWESAHSRHALTAF